MSSKYVRFALNIIHRLTVDSNTQPTPLYFMDEIDAALDFRNVSIIANYIKSKTEAAQLYVYDEHELEAA